MGVYVFDMEMPKNCAACPLRASCVHRIYLERRADYCPLVYVPPHGRLIDADAFISFIREKWDSYDQWFAEMLEARPTIIPADPEKEE